jgi:DNA-binding transcriptional MerR regulator
VIGASVLQDKYFYTIGEVCRLTGLKPHILRYWESEFKLLKPARRYSGHRKFTQKDLDLIQRIKFLVVDRKYTLAGAKKEINRQLGGKMRGGELTLQTPVSAAIPLLQDIKREIDDCLGILESDPDPYEPGLVHRSMA